VKGHQYSESGGQLDFVRSAYVSCGGKSTIAFHLTTGCGNVSEVVARLAGLVTRPRTEPHLGRHGIRRSEPEPEGSVVDTTRRPLIRLAPPDVRDTLTAQARELHRTAAPMKSSSWRTRTLGEHAGRVRPGRDKVSGERLGDNALRSTHVIPRDETLR